MFITTQNEIISLMPTARWDRPSQLFGYLEEEERVALEPLLGTALYDRLCTEYERLREEYEDITATTIRPTGVAREDARLAYADVTERLEQIQEGLYREAYTASEDGEAEVPAKDMQAADAGVFDKPIDYNSLMKKAIEFSDGIIFNSPDVDQELILYAKARKVKVMRYLKSGMKPEKVNAFYNKL